MATDNSGQLNVFICYSHRDALDFADQLAKALELLEFHPLLDREGISGGEEWKGRLGQLILECDTVVFVLTPESAASPVCTWEVEEAQRSEYADPCQDSWRTILPDIESGNGRSLYFATCIGDFWS